jgi:hypothetical protein
MQSLGSFAPSNIESKLSPDGGCLHVAFNDDQHSVHLRFHPANVEAAFQTIIDGARVERSPQLTGQPDSLVVPDGYHVRRTHDGQVELTLHVRTDDGRGSVSYPMPPEVAAQMAELLKKSAA